MKAATTPRNTNIAARESVSAPSGTGGSAARPSRLICLLGVALVLAAALYTRLKPLDQVFALAGMQAVTSDSYLHLRRILMTARSYPVVPYFDNYNGFPAGIEINWPPLWDFAVVSLAKVLGLGRPSEQLLLVVAVMFPVLVGLAVVLTLGLVSWRLFGRGAIWPTCIVAALFLLPFARPELTFINISLFHVVALGSMGSVPIGLSLLGATYARTRRRRLLLVGGLGLALTTLSLPLAGRFWWVVIAGLVKAFGLYPWPAPPSYTINFSARTRCCSWPAPHTAPLSC